MARVKRAVQNKKKHKAVLEQAKGYYGDKSRTFRAANEQVMHSGNYAFRDRRARNLELQTPERGALGEPAHVRQRRAAADVKLGERGDGQRREHRKCLAPMERQPGERGARLEPDERRQRAAAV